MKPISRVSLYLFVVSIFCACSFVRQASKPEVKPSPEVSTGPTSPAAPSTTTAQPTTAAGDLQVGQASGTYTAKGETVELKYAYAGRAERFGQEAIVILLTDKPIPPEALAEELKSQTLLLDEKIRGLEYAIDDNGMWVRYHPGQYQESTSNQLKDYVVEGDVVRGFDDNDGHLSDGKYSRKVKFVAAITK